MIKFRNVSKSYQSGVIKKRNNKVLDNINLHIKKGRVCGLIGNSGSGKSTIAKILCGLEIYDDGEVLLHDFLLEKGIYNKEINIIFQHPESSFDPRMTIFKNFKEILSIQKIYKEENLQDIIYKYVDLVGLDRNLLNRRVSEISGGEAQRFAIARSLMTESKFLILDEATSMLDVLTQSQILNLLKDLKLKNKELTYLFITHDLELAKSFCDDIAIINKGKIIEYGLVEEVFNNPKTDYVKNIIEAFNKLN